MSQVSPACHLLMCVTLSFKMARQARKRHRSFPTQIPQSIYTRAYIYSCCSRLVTAFPTPHQVGQIIGRGGSPAKNPRPFWPLLATPGRGQTISGAAAMAVPSSIDTGTPAPAIRLPLDPAPLTRESTPFRRNRACDLVFTRDRQRCGDEASRDSPVNSRHSPHPQLPT